ncbi:phage major capsid protein [uncultured Clostridium sp.]|uniref:phage major capsid protein n=1 Tax=uncultured Clostridium sp. TaxID=59620 RepID=UPI0025FEEBDF|nr:phage major capsid protein [uncultured Clostridium sp.]
MKKALVEKRNALVEELEGLLATVETEVRAFNEEETARVAEIKAEIEGLNTTIATQEERRNLQEIKKDEVDTNMEKRELYAQELRGLSVGANGGLVPTEIQSEIVKAVYNQAPIAEMAKIYNVVGDLTINVQDGALTVGFVDELSASPDTNVVLKTKTLKSNGVRVLTKISNQLLLDSTVDVVSEVIAIVASELAKFINDALVMGASDKVEGLANTTNTVTIAGDEVALVDLVALMNKIPSHKADKGVFILAPATLSKVQAEALEKGVLGYAGLAGELGMTLFGKRVFTVDAMEGIETAIFANVAEGYAIKMPENVSITLMREIYLAQNQTGIHASAHFDGCITNEALVAKLKAGAPAVMRAKK